MSQNQIIINNLSKVYDNGFKALKKINLSIKKGEIFAMLGPNGAGDMFAGGVIHGLSEGWENDKSVKFGNFLASKGVTEIGPRLKKNKYVEYLKEFSKK